MYILPYVTLDLNYMDTLQPCGIQPLKYHLQLYKNSTQVAYIIIQLQTNNYAVNRYF